jgi:hypothetical protein
MIVVVVVTMLLTWTCFINRHLRANPHDIDKWIEFAAFQERFVTIGGRAAPGAADDKRIAVLQTALRDNADDERLLLAYLTA